MKVVGVPSFVKYGSLNLKATNNLVVTDSPFFSTILLRVIGAMGKRLCNLGKKVKISGGEGSGCINDGPDAWAVGPAEDGSKLNDNVGEVRVDFDGKDGGRRRFGGGKHLPLN
jgi:hypothetical protein